MAKFHINAKGIPAICKATKGNCPFGGSTGIENHFDTIEEAQEYANSKNEEKFGLLGKQENNVNIQDTFINYLHIIDKLNEAGHKGYFVGGSLRDILMGLPVSDVDITTSATPDETMEAFPEYPVLPVGLEHGTVVLVIDNEAVEITSFRTEGEYSDSRRPDSVSFTKSLDEDLQRRDFTINALAYNPEEGLVDLVNGVEDIDNKLIRAVGVADERFREDPLRILRGLRFASKLGFNVEEDTKKAMFANKELLHTISKERLQKELNGLLLGKNAKNVLLEYPDVILEVIPELKPMIGYEQRSPYHDLTLWEHTCTVVENAKDDPAHKLAALFHDIGKLKTMTYNEEKQQAHYIGHEVQSVDDTKEILKRLKYDKKTIDRVGNIITDHGYRLTENQYKMKKAIYELGQERYEDMLAFNRADDLSKKDGKKDIAIYDKMEENMRVYLTDKPILSHKDLDVNAKDLMALGIKGKDLGETLNELVLLALAGQPNEKERQLKYVKRNR